MSWDRVRLLLILIAAAALIWLIPESETKWPVLMVLLGLPLALGLVPKSFCRLLRQDAFG